MKMNQKRSSAENSSQEKSEQSPIHWFRSRALSREGFLQRLGAGILLVSIGLLLFHRFLDPDGLFVQNPQQAFEGPSWQSFMGRDALGRSFSLRMMWAIRQSIVLTFFANIIAFFVALSFSLMSMVSPRVYLIFNFLSDVFLSLPRLVLFIVLASLVSQLQYWSGVGSSSLVLIVTLGVLTWMPIYRLFIPILKDDYSKKYVQAAVVSGQSEASLFFSEILPNIQSFILHIFVFRWASLLIFEGFLGFIGLGAQAPFSSWGGLISEGLAFADLGFHLLFFPSFFFLLGVGSLLY